MEPPGAAVRRGPRPVPAPAARTDRRRRRPLDFPDVPIADPNDDAVLSAVATGLPTRFFVAGYARRPAGVPVRWARRCPATGGRRPGRRRRGDRLADRLRRRRGDRPRHPPADDHADRRDAHPPRRVRRARGATPRRRATPRSNSCSTVHAQRDGVALLEPGHADEQHAGGAHPDDRPRLRRANRRRPAASGPVWPRRSASAATSSRRSPAATTSPSRRSRRCTRRCGR